MLEGVMRHGRATWSEELLLWLNRHLPREECYFTFSYSPILVGDASRVGIFCAVTETTDYVLGRRRLETLRELGRRTAQVDSAEGACRRALEALAENPRDVPLAALYLIDRTRNEARLCGSVSAGELLPAHVSLDGGDEPGWPIAEVWASRRSVEVALPADRRPSPARTWAGVPSKALVVPVVAPGVEALGAVLVVGINPGRPLDADYRAFFHSIASQIGAAVAESCAYEAERQRAEALAELDRAKTTFFSNVSHEFRTPLALMLGPLEETLGEGELRLETRDALEVVHRNGLRLLRLVNTLLDFSRIEAGRAEAVFEPVDLAVLTAEVASVFRPAVERAGLTLEVDCEPTTSSVFVDRDMWEKIVLNLLSNAFKFTLQGGITVALRERDSTVQLVVRDTGVGIPPAELPHVFERFHRVQGTEGRTHEGTGIGLALVSELVKLHGGEVGVESELGRGSAFTVRLPTGAAHLPRDRVGATRTRASTALGARPFIEEALRWLPAEEEALVEPHSGAPQTDVLTPGARVLVADDNADMRAYIVRLLEPHWRVEAVADGEAALAALRRYRPDVLVTDVMMPKLDGIELTRAIRGDPELRTLPVILLSARAGEESRIEGVAAGADDYVTKPFSARELVARVNAHLALSRVRADAEAAIRSSEERLRFVLDRAQVGYWDWDFAAERLEWSASCKRIFGFGEDDGEVSRRLVFGAIHPQDREELRRVLRVCLEGGPELDARFRVLRPEGSMRWVHVKGNASFDGTRPVRIAGIAMDVTDQRDAEDALRGSRDELNQEKEALARLYALGERCASSSASFEDCVENILDTALWLSGADMAGLYLQDERSSALRLVAHRGFSEQLAATLASASPGDVAFPGASRRIVVEDGAASRAFSGRLLEALREAGVRTVESTPLVCSSGRPMGMVATHFRKPRAASERDARLLGLLARQAADYLARRQGDEQREELLRITERARAEAEAANRAKDEFLATVSHELRSPLQGILGWLTLLRRGRVEPAETARALERSSAAFASRPSSSATSWTSRASQRARSSSSATRSTWPSCSGPRPTS
ncbi:MAG: ATP-binding protein [Thermodesulfobacteriota bacterium]